MNKSELIQHVASRADLSRAQATKVVDALFSVENGIISEALRGGDKVQITGFGSFETKRREAREGRNPRTGNEIDGGMVTVDFQSGIQVTPYRTIKPSAQTGLRTREEIRQAVSRAMASDG